MKEMMKDMMYEMASSKSKNVKPSGEYSVADMAGKLKDYAKESGRGVGEIMSELKSYVTDDSIDGGDGKYVEEDSMMEDFKDEKPKGSVGNKKALIVAMLKKKKGPAGY